MINRNMPATGYEGNDYHMEGLTKLEYAAIAAMNGLIINNLGQFNMKAIAMRSVEQANKLFDFLEKDQ